MIRFYKPADCIVLVEAAQFNSQVLDMPAGYTLLRMENNSWTSGGRQMLVRVERMKCLAILSESCSHVLVEQDRVPVGVDCDKTGRSGRALICLAHQLHALRLELAL